MCELALKLRDGQRARRGVRKIPPVDHCRRPTEPRQNLVVVIAAKTITGWHRPQNFLDLREQLFLGHTKLLQSSRPCAHIRHCLPIGCEIAIVYVVAPSAEAVLEFDLASDVRDDSSLFVLPAIVTKLWFEESVGPLEIVLR